MFICILPVDSVSHLAGTVMSEPLHGASEETEARWYEVTCSRPHCWPVAELGLEPDRLSYLCILAAIYPSDSCGPTKMFGVQAQLQVLWQMSRVQWRACPGRRRIWWGGDSVPTSHLSAELCDKSCGRDR